MVYYIYILQSVKDRKYYIGATANVNARLDYHNSGRQRSTKHRIPFRLIYLEECVDMPTALRLEKQIKIFQGGGAFKRLVTKE